MKFKKLNFICFVLAAVFAIAMGVAVSQVAAEAVNTAYADNTSGIVINAGQRGTWR